jgi:hypothetical protein
MLGPSWNPHDKREGREVDSASPEVMSRTRAVADRLAADFTHIEQRSGGWRDEELAAALVDAALSAALAELAETGCWGRANQIPSSELWRATEPWLRHGWLQHRARTKPRGYAGDDELLTRIYERKLSTDPIGRVFDRYFQGQAAAEAVRSRTDQTAAALVSHCLRGSGRAPYRIVSVGAGPALELARAARILPAVDRSRWLVTLVDIDEESLQRARDRLSAWLLPQQIITRRENLFRLGNNPRLASCVGPVDFSICTGLFDYLAPGPAQDLLGVLWKGLLPGGMLLVGNFAPHCPTRAYMEWIGNWYLIYRTRDELWQLAIDAGLPAGACQIGAERLGVDLFLNAERGAGGIME